MIWCIFMGFELKRGLKVISFLLIVVLLSLTIVNSVSAEDYVIANTHDWKSIYELSMYANFKNMSFTYLKDLGDAEIKTKLMSKNDNLIVFESSKDPVVKNFDSFLKINGYTLVGRYSFNDVFDLQEYLHDQIKPSANYIFGTDFGMEPIIAAPYLLKENIFPLFYSKDSVDFFYKISRREKLTIVGRVPIRAIDKLKNKELKLGNPKIVTGDLTKNSFQNVRSDWAVLTRIDNVDLTTIAEGNPLFVYFDPVYIEELASLMKQSKIKNYEVIGGTLADIAKLLESKTGENLNLMLKFGRKITNLQGLEDKILNVDAISLPYPQENLIIKSITYDEKNHVLLLTLENLGNIDVYAFSSIDFGGVAVSDKRSHKIRLGETRTIPYPLNTTKLDGNATLTIKYGYSFPLLNSLKGENSASIVKQLVKIKRYDDRSNINFKEAYFDAKRGILTVKISKLSKNTPLVMGELFLGENSYTSELKKITGDNAILLFKFPYLPNNMIINKKASLKLYYGDKDLLFTETKDVLIQEQETDYTISILVVILVIVLILFWFLLFRKKRKNEEDKPKKRNTTRRKGHK